MDKIFIKGLKAKAYIGIHAWEQQVAQTIVIDCELTIDATHAATTDQIEKTVNYQIVTERLKKFVAAKPFQLVETLAEALAELIKTEFSVSYIRLTVGKPCAFADVELVGVIIER